MDPAELGPARSHRRDRRCCRGYKARKISERIDLVGGGIGHNMVGCISMITEYRDNKAAKMPGRWYTYTYDNGLRVTFAEYQGDLNELEDLGRELSRKKKREVRMRVHEGSTDRIHAIFRYGRK